MIHNRLSVLGVAAGVFLALLASTSVHARQQAEGQTAAIRLSDIRSLYESAEYDRAIAAAAMITPSALPASEVRDIEIYESLCQLALGNASEAEQAIAAVLRTDPLYEPSSDLPNRLRSLVETVRDRIRPALAQAHYKAGRQFYQSGNYTSAVREFSIVLELTEGKGEDAAVEFADLRILASSFLELSNRTLPASASQGGSALDVKEPGNAAPVDLVTPPVTIRQDVPPWPAALGDMLKQQSRTGVLSGIVDVLIGADGTVQSARMVKSIHPLYDTLLLAAASHWTYRPAMKGSVPVAYTKRLAINVH
jgi:hypothetical protein